MVEKEKSLSLYVSSNNRIIMGTKELLEFEAKGYVEGRNIVPPACVTPTQRGHANCVTLHG
ncbi:hypothetical protein FACS1894162_4520 [Bacteroidia bacterium]|nr:hypothetical protein FACS1894162_4520 [Bacteroidia bacterium]